MITLRRLLTLAIFFAATPFLSQAGPPVIILDPGHGGSAVAGSLRERSNSSPNNATSPGGIKEKDLTLEFSQILKNRILQLAREREKVVGVLLTRESDINLDFIERAKIAAHPDTACVISIHFNAGGGGKSQGSLSLIAAKERNPNYEADRAFGDALARACSEGVQRHLPSSQSKGTITDEHLHGGRGSNFFFQLARHPGLAKTPKVFLEIDFMDNPAVEKALLQGDRPAKFADIATPIAQFLLDYLESSRNNGAVKKP